MKFQCCEPFHSPVNNFAATLTLSWKTQFQRKLLTFLIVI